MPVSQRETGRRKTRESRYTIYEFTPNALVMEYIEAPVEVRNEGIEKRLFEALAAKLEPQRFELWFKNSRLRLEETKLVVGVQTAFAISFVRANFLREIDQACVECLGKSFPVDVVICREEPAVVTTVPSACVPVPHLSIKRSAVPAPVGVDGLLRGNLLVSEASEPLPTGSDQVSSTAVPLLASPLRSIPTNKLNAVSGRRFASLQTFVEGTSNRLACKAADLAVNHPGEISPIYIFGPSSVGKTHLLEGIWSAVRRQQVRKPPLYLTSEQYISSFQASIQQKSTADGFRSKFKGISILLIDDIQYLSGKNATQTEFLHTIDTLRTLGVQLVFSGDRPVRELTGFRSEIICRLEGGMACLIEQPERETMLHIFRNMVQQRRLPIGDDVCRLVASRLNAHARQLSGALNRLHTAYLSGGGPITPAVAEEVLDDLIRNNRRNVRLKDIGKAVCETLGLPEEALLARGQSKQVAAARMLAMWLARKHTRSALSEIGRFFGGRSHSTVFNSLKKVDGWIDEKNPIHAETFDLPLTDAIRKIERILQAG